MKTDKLILDACCGPRMMWFDKRNPQAVFMDIRDEEHIPVSYTHLTLPTKA